MASSHRWPRPWPRHSWSPPAPQSGASPERERKRRERRQLAPVGLLGDLVDAGRPRWREAGQFERARRPSSSGRTGTRRRASAGCNTYGGTLHGRRHDHHVRAAPQHQDGRASSRDDDRDRVPRRPPGQRPRYAVDGTGTSCCPGPPTHDVHARRDARARAVVKLAHVRERTAPAGAPWRLAAALDRRGERTGSDLEIARRRAVAERPALAHDAVLSGSRSRRSTTTWPAASGSRRWPSSSRASAARRSRRGRRGPRGRRPRASGRRSCGRPSFRDFYAFERHVGTMWERRGGEIPEAWYRLPIFYFSNTSEIRGPDDPVWAPRGSDGARLRAGGRRARRHAGPRPARPSGRGGDRRLLRPQRLVGARPPARRDGRPARAGQGQGLRDVDRAVARDARRAGRRAAARRDRAGPRDDGDDRRSDGDRRPDRRGVARVVGERALLVRPDARARLRRRAPAARATCSGSGTVGGGCLLEVKDETLGRYLEPGDEVVLDIERLGVLRNPIVARGV